MNAFIVGMAAGAVLFSGHGVWVCALGSLTVGILNLLIERRKLEAQG